MVESAVLNRVRARGFGSAFPSDLLAIGAARRLEDIDGTEADAKTFLLSGGSIKGLDGLSVDRLSQSFGHDVFEASRVMALVELGRRLGNAGRGPVAEITCAADIAELLQHLSGEKQEHVVAVLLDTKSHVLRQVEVHIGTVDTSLVGIKEIFREAVREGATRLIVAHNHPSGDPTPSQEDIEITKRLEQAGNILEIEVLDHVIIGDRKWVSLREERLMGL